MPGVLVDKLTVLTGVPVPLADGLVGLADVYLPDDGEAHPVLLSRTPYSRALTSLTMFNPLRAVRRGYVVVIQDCRGRYKGEGGFTPFENEAADGAAAIDWCATQSWSDGRVAMWGASYVGATQLLAATASPKALLAVSPSFTAANYRTGWLLEDEVVQQHFLQTWSASIGSTMSGVTAEARREFGAFTSGTEAFHRPLDEALGSHAEAVVPYYGDWLRRRDDVDYWNQLNIDGRHHELDVAGLHIGGWYDVFVEGTLANFEGLGGSVTTEGQRRVQHLLVGPWEHTVVESVVGEVDFGPLAGAAMVDLPGTQLKFFDAALSDGEPNLPLVQAFVMGANEWRSFEEWPPPATDTLLHLDGAEPQSVRGDGALRFTSPAQDRSWRMAFDPQRPVPTMGGRLVAPGSRIAGPREQSSVEARDDVLVFTSEPLTEPMTVAGPVHVVVQAQSGTPAYDICVKLTDVDERGRSVNIVDGVTRVHGDQPAEICVRLGSTAHQFGRGHRIRVQIAGSNHPRLELCGTDPAFTTVFARRSHVVLPVLPATPDTTPSR